MTEKWIDVKFPKDALYGIFCLFGSSHILFIITLLIIINDVRTGIGAIIDLCLLLFLLCIGWGTSLFIYFRVPKSILINENELLLKRRGTENIKKMAKKQIHKVRLIKSYMAGEFMCGIHYSLNNPEYAIGIDFESGKKVYDWYYGHKEEDGPRPIKNFYWRDKKKERR